MRTRLLSVRLSVLSFGSHSLSCFMQDFILDPRNKERIDRFKLALLNFERFDIEGLDLVVPTVVLSNLALVKDKTGNCGER
jgi:hypothetical protein